MKPNSLPGVLVVLLALSMVCAVALTIIYNRHTSRLRQQQARLAEIQNTERIIQQLANEAMEYSKRDPAILSVLQPFGVNTSPAAAARTAPAAAPKAATKTATKTR